VKTVEREGLRPHEEELQHAAPRMATAGAANAAFTRS
jgi:hypothetical protein